MGDSCSSVVQATCSRGWWKIVGKAGQHNRISMSMNIMELTRGLGLLALLAVWSLSGEL